jgi:hypothetical protein
MLQDLVADLFSVDDTNDSQLVLFLQRNRLQGHDGPVYKGLRELIRGSRDFLLKLHSAVVLGPESEEWDAVLAAIAAKPRSRRAAGEPRKRAVLEKRWAIFQLFEGIQKGGSRTRLDCRPLGIEAELTEVDLLVCELANINEAVFGQHKLVKDIIDGLRDGKFDARSATI